jgi:transcriptional regulator with XRE-family HTH domain
LSQLDLACEANISPRHLSFVETGRSMPSRDMILHLADADHNLRCVTCDRAATVEASSRAAATISTLSLTIWLR